MQIFVKFGWVLGLFWWSFGGFEAVFCVLKKADFVQPDRPVVNGGQSAVQSRGWRFWGLAAMRSLDHPVVQRRTVHGWMVYSPPGTPDRPVRAFVGPSGAWFFGVVLLILHPTFWALIWVLPVAIRYIPVQWTAPGMRVFECKSLRGFEFEF